MTLLITITGPIGAGKNTAAEALATRYAATGTTVVIADVDEVAAMVQGEGAGATGLWLSAHRAHAALVAAWLQTPVGVVIAVGPFIDAEEHAILDAALPAGVAVTRVLIEAPIDVTWSRVVDDPARGLSRVRDFHEQTHPRYRRLRDTIPTDLIIDSARHAPERIAELIDDRVRDAGL